MSEHNTAKVKAIIAADEAKERAAGRMKGGTVAKEGQEEGKDIVLTMEEFQKAMGVVIKDFTQKLDTVTGQNEKLKLTLEMLEAKSEVGKPIKGKVEIIAVRHGPIDHQQALVELHQEKLKGKASRFVNNKPDIRSLRRSQGYSPILDKDNNEVRYVDGVLMAMPEKQYDETIREPNKEKREFRRKSIPGRFHEAGEELGVETSGKITYDKEP